VAGKKLIVVGGGPAGMIAAGTAGSRGLDVVMLEKNERLGRKLLITGKGRCNITNITDLEGLIANVPDNGKFLFSAFHTFSNRSLLDLLHSLGLKTKVERGGRVFPKSDRSSDVVTALERYMRQNKVQIMRGEVKKVLSENGSVSGVQLNDGRIIIANRVIVATGGISYPQTGSTGDGYRFAIENGHSIVEPKPSLVPLETREAWVRDLKGLSLRNVAINILTNEGEKVYTDFGEMLFTHYGVSGPIILSASTHLQKGKVYKLLIDLKPALSLEQLDSRIQRDFAKYSRKIFANALGDLLPRKLIPVVIRLVEIPSEKPVHQITREERRRLVSLLKALELEISGYRPPSEAIITSGGVSVKEVNPSTMESKITKGLYFAGEVLDVSAYTGGFNLQIAFSTGYLAGSNC
jgi:hypothetical protein